MRELCDDLAAEHDDLDRIVSGLDEDGWNTPTPAEGWAVRDQISHLAFFDGTATEAVVDPEAFRAGVEAAENDTDAYINRHIEEGRSIAGAELLERWRAGRQRMLQVFAGLDPDQRIPWYGPAMGARSFVTARLMETWAHGQDVADALHVERAPTDRLRHVAHIGVRARPWSYIVRGKEPPVGEVRVELTSPGGDVWAWGDETAANRISGTALDFCLVTTQRRHPADTDLVAEGPLAEEWLSIAQAFAGPPGEGRRPGEFR
jgi:uncharacterized protein (TIGR03084 family)